MPDNQTSLTDNFASPPESWAGSEYEYIYNPDTMKFERNTSLVPLPDPFAVINNYANNSSEDPNVNEREANYAVSYTTDSVSSKMGALANTISKLDKKFNSGIPVYTQYLHFSVNGSTLVDTTSKNWCINNLVSFELQQNGSGAANKFTLTIMFVQNDRNIQSIETIDATLLQASSPEVNGTPKSVKELYMDCYFVYGYGDDKSLRSEPYTGKIMDWDVSLENGNLKYVITGLAGLYFAKEIKLSPKPEYLQGATRNGDEEEILPLKYIENIFNVEFGENGAYPSEYKLVIYDNCFKDGKEGATCKGKDLLNFSQKNIFDIIKDILAASLSPIEKSDIDSHKIFYPSQKQCYGFYVDSKKTADANGTVYIYKMPSLSKTSDTAANDTQADMDITFNWFAPSGTGVDFLVKSWKPEFKGSMAIALALTYQIKGDKFETMDDNGNIVPQNGMGATRLGVKDDSRIITHNGIQEYSQWSYNTQYPYKAKLTVQGCPCEVPITGKIKVNAKMGNQNHSSSGIYYVMSKRDIMNNSGYFTEFELFKIVSTFNPDALEGAFGDNESSNESNAGDTGDGAQE